jgi:hypothetical protein
MHHSQLKANASLFINKRMTYHSQKIYVRCITQKKGLAAGATEGEPSLMVGLEEAPAFEAIIVTEF